MTLSNYTAPALLVPRLRSHDAAAAVAELCSVMHREGRVEELLPFYNEVISRENLSSTATQPGWAMPHARSQHVKQLCFAVGLTSEPLDWFGNTGEPVSAVFLFAVPDTQAAAYLQLVSALARFSRDPLRVERLVQAADREAMFELFQQVSLRPPRAAAVGMSRLRFP